MSGNKSQEIESLIGRGFEEFSRIFMLYDRTARRTMDTGKGVMVTPTMANLIEVIGRCHGSTVTSLSVHFMTTKGAVSQIISRLVKEGLARKDLKRSIDNEQPLTLTTKGQHVFKWHEEYNKPVREALLKLSSHYRRDQLRSFVEILSELRSLFEDLSRKA